MNDDVEIVQHHCRADAICDTVPADRSQLLACALARKLNISEPAISQHMNVFKRYDL